MTPDELLEALQSLFSLNDDNENVFKNSGDKEAFAALIQSVPDDVAREWLDSNRFPEYPMNYYLRGKIGFAPRSNSRSADNLKRPISEILADFCDKGKGKRTAARNELQKRFQHCDWKEQLEVFEVMLNASAQYKSYRDWVFTTLRSYFWDDLKNIERQFNSSKSKELQQAALRICTDHLDEYYTALFVVQKLELPWIQQYQDRLAKSLGYFPVAKRLMESPDFEPEINQLAKSHEFFVGMEDEVFPDLLKDMRLFHKRECGYKYYYLMAKFQRKVDREEARKFMYECLIHDKGIKRSTNAADSDAMPTVLQDSEMARLMMNYGRLGLTELILECNEIEHSARVEFQEKVLELKTTAPMYNDRCWYLYLDIVRKTAFRRYYSEEDLKRLKEKNLIEYYKTLSKARVTIDEDEVRENLARLIRDASKLSLDRSMVGRSAEEYSLRLNNNIKELTDIYEMAGLRQATKDFASFNSLIQLKFNQLHKGQTVENEEQAQQLWHEFVSMAQNELYYREHTEETAEKLMAKNPELKALIDDLDLRIEKFDKPI